MLNHDHVLVKLVKSFALTVGIVLVLLAVLGFCAFLTWSLTNHQSITGYSCLGVSFLLLWRMVYSATFEYKSGDQ